MTLNLNDSMPGTSSEAASCSSFSDSYKGCYQESIDTFNLPITIEFDFVIKNAWYKVAGVGFQIYESAATFSNNLTGVVSTGEKLGSVGWHYSYNLSDGVADSYNSNNTFFVVTDGILGRYLYYRTDQRIDSQGSLKLEIDVDGNFTSSFIATDGTLIDSRSGVLSELPLNFKIRFYQTLYGSGSNHYKRYVNFPSLSGYSNVIDNITITYE